MGAGGLGTRGGGREPWSWGARFAGGREGPRGSQLVEGWPVLAVECATTHGVEWWAVESGEWRVGSGEWRVESGQWAVESGEWRVESGELPGGKGGMGPLE